MYGEVLKGDFIFDNSLPLAEVAKISGIFSVTNSTADRTIFSYLNPCICVGLDKYVMSKITNPYKKVLGKLCHQNEIIVIEALKKLNNNDENFNEYKSNLRRYLNSISFANEKFDEQLINIFQN